MFVYSLQIPRYFKYNKTQSNWLVSQSLLETSSFLFYVGDEGVIILIDYCIIVISSLNTYADR